MMGGGAFLLLKAGLIGPKTGKQVETRVAILLKVLPIRGKPARTTQKIAWGLYLGHVPPDMANLCESRGFVIRIIVSVPQ
jgi:hypothetical protein